MNPFSKLRIGARLGVAFGLTILALVLVALFARLALGEVQDDLRVVTHDRMPKIEALGEVRENLNVVARAVRNVALLDDSAAQAAEFKRIEEARVNNTRLLKRLEETITTPEGLKLLSTLESVRKSYNAELDKALALSRQDNPQALRQLLTGSLRQAQGQYFEGLNALTAYQHRLMEASEKEVSSTVDNTNLFLVLATVAAALVSGALGWWTTRSITVPIARAVEVAETVARGDLGSRIESHGGDETAMLLKALKSMNESLVDIVGRVRANAESVATASTQISQGNTDLSQRTEEQASNLQQTAASMEQITATVKHNADIARRASHLAVEASGVATRGGEVVGRVVATMDEISASSRRIGDIIGTIDGIAFQTNILALNAAVEAARAGEQGRGFAVVAGEVRNLAQRAAEAAREIKSLIAASVEKVEAGSGLVGDAGRTMGEIVGQVRKVSDILDEIDHSSIEQSEGVGQVDAAMQQLDQVTQQNAALVEESAAAAESLRQQAQQLTQAVAFFRTGAAAA